MENLIKPSQNCKCESKHRKKKITHFENPTLVSLICQQLSISILMVMFVNMLAIIVLGTVFICMEWYILYMKITNSSNAFMDSVYEKLDYCRRRYDILCWVGILYMTLFYLVLLYNTLAKRELKITFANILFFAFGYEPTCTCKCHDKPIQENQQSIQERQFSS